jgi:hypothetical protein
MALTFPGRLLLANAAAAAAVQTTAPHGTSFTRQQTQDARTPDAHGAEGRGTFTAPGVTLVKVTRALAGWARRARLGRRPHRRRRHARHRLPGRGRLADGRAPSPQRRIAAQRASADAEVAGSPLQGGVSGMCVRRAAVRFRQRGPSQKLGPRCRGGLCGSGVRRCCTRVRRPSGRRCGSCGSARRSAPGRPARRCPRRGRSAPRRRSARRSPPRARRRAVT